MVSLETIEREINEVESRCDTTYRTCERLAWLYVCRDHLRPTESPVQSVTDMVPRMDGSDFLKVASGKRVEDVMKVMDEHVQTMAMLYPTTYDNIMSRIREL